MFVSLAVPRGSGTLSTLKPIHLGSPMPITVSKRNVLNKCVSNNRCFINVYSDIHDDARG